MPSRAKTSVATVTTPRLVSTSFDRLRDRSSSCIEAASGDELPGQGGAVCADQGVLCDVLDMGQERVLRLAFEQAKAVKHNLCLFRAGQSGRLKGQGMSGHNRWGRAGQGKTGQGRV